MVSKELSLCHKLKCFLSMQPKSLISQTMIIWVHILTLGCKDMGLENQSLWQRLISFHVNISRNKIGFEFKILIKLNHCHLKKIMNEKLSMSWKRRKRRFNGALACYHWIYVYKIENIAVHPVDPVVCLQFNCLSSTISVLSSWKDFNKI